MTGTAGEHAILPCESCGAPIIWGETERGKRVAVDADTNAGGVVKLVVRTYATTPLVVPVGIAARFGLQLYTTHGTPCRRRP